MKSITRAINSAYPPLSSWVMTNRVTIVSLYVPWLIVHKYRKEKLGKIDYFPIFYLVFISVRVDIPMNTEEVWNVKRKKRNMNEVFSIFCLIFVGLKSFFDWKFLCYFECRNILLRYGSNIFFVQNIFFCCRMNSGFHLFYIYLINFNFVDSFYYTDFLLDIFS